LWPELYSLRRPDRRDSDLRRHEVRNAHLSQRPTELQQRLHRQQPFVQWNLQQRRPQLPGRRLPSDQYRQFMRDGLSAVPKQAERNGDNLHERRVRVFV
jgi:hypothetical protein